MASLTNAQGTLLKIDSGSSVFNTIPACADVNIPSAARSYNEGTSHDSAGGFRQWVPGLLDGSEIPFKFFYDPTNAIHQQVIVDANSNPGTLRAFKIVGPTSTFNTWLFSAYVSLDPIVMSVGKLMEVSGKLRVTGAVTYPVA